MAYTLTPELWEQHLKEATELIDDLKRRDIKPTVLLVAAARVILAWEAKNSSGDDFAANIFYDLLKMGEEAFGLQFAKEPTLE